MHARREHLVCKSGRLENLLLKFELASAGLLDKFISRAGWSGLQTA